VAGLLLGWAVATAGARALSGALDRFAHHDDELDALPAPSPVTGSPVTGSPTVDSTTTGSTLPR
jgi:hypothetical protein